MSLLDAIPQGRIQKLEAIRSRGIDPYPPRYRRSHTNREAIALFAKLEQEGGVESCPEISLAGRITAARHMGKLSFLDLRDGTERIQVSFRSDAVNPETFQFVRDLDLGDFIGVTGRLFRTRTG